MASSFRRLVRSQVLCWAVIAVMAVAWAGIAFCRGAGGSGGAASASPAAASGGSIHHAVQSGDLAGVKAMLQANPSLVSSKDSEYGASPLQVAAACGHKEIAELLLANKAEVNAKNNDGATALHMATMLGRKDLVELLLSNKAEVNARDSDGFTPLHAAAVKDRADLAELLLAHNADVNAKDNDGATALHCAAGRGFKNVGELLLAHKADINARDSKDKCPLHWASAYERKEMMEWLLAHKAEVKARDKYGRTCDQPRGTTREWVPLSVERWRRRGVSIGGGGLNKEVNDFPPVMLPAVPKFDAKCVDATVWGQDTPNPFTNITPEGKAMLEERCLDIDKLARYKAVLITGNYCGANRRDFVNTRADVILVFGEGFITHGDVISAGPVLAMGNAHFMGNITARGLAWFVEKSFPRGQTLGAPIIIAPTAQKSQIKLPEGQAWFGDYGWQKPVKK
jgi:hypothetical protein